MTLRVLIHTYTASQDFGELLRFNQAVTAQEAEGNMRELPDDLSNELDTCVRSSDAGLGSCVAVGPARPVAVGATARCLPAQRLSPSTVLDRLTVPAPPTARTHARALPQARDASPV